MGCLTSKEDVVVVGDVGVAINTAEAAPAPAGLNIPLQELLEELGLQQYVPVFAAEGYTLSVALATLKVSGRDALTGELKELGLKLGERSKLASKLESLATPLSAPPQSTSPAEAQPSQPQAQPPPPLQPSPVDPGTSSPGPTTVGAADPTPADLLAADVARVAAEAAAPLPEGSRWHDLGGAELEPLFAHTDVIDAAWLLRLAEGEVMPERKGVVPLWQELPDEAKLTLPQLRQTTMMNFLPVAILSYGWASKAHPDPDGTLLRRLVPTLRAMVGCCAKGEGRDYPDDKPLVFGIVWDALSLPQRGRTTGYDPKRDDRTPYQLARFGGGLGAVNVWYGHPYVTTLTCDFEMPPGAENAAPIDRRGWCIFERWLSSIAKDGYCHLYLSLVPSDAGQEGSKAEFWFRLAMKACAARRAPLTPDAFESMMRDGMAREAEKEGTGFRFTNGKDATAVCIPQYREAFGRLLGGGEALDFTGCGWSDDEAGVLFAALAHLHAAGTPAVARMLSLGLNALTDAGMPPLARLLTSGALPRLKELFLYANRIGDDGAASLAGSMAEGGMRAVKEIWLDDNRIGDAGARALVGALGGAPALEELRIGGNPLSEAAVEEVREGCRARGVKATKGRDDML